MSDPLSERFADLAPTASQQARMQVRVLEHFVQQPRALWREWIDLILAAPLRNGAWVLAAALVLILTSPLGAVLGVLARAPTAQTFTQLAPAGPRTAAVSEVARAPGARSGAMASRSVTVVAKAP